MQITTQNGSSAVVTGTFDPPVDDGRPFFSRGVGDVLRITDGNPAQPWLTIDRIDQDSGTAYKPIQARLVKAEACLTVTLPVAHTGVVVVKDAAGNTLFTTTPK